MSEPAVRSEFLFCYDTRMANPNGDPDENRPRIDGLTGKNMVTDFRLKRTIRDYIAMMNAQEPGMKVFMRSEKVDDSDSLKQVEDLAEAYITKVGAGKKSKPVLDGDKLIKDHVDIRLFGLMFTVPGLNFKRFASVVFETGLSLNPVEEIPIRLTRMVPTREDAKGGTFGDRYVVRYSFITFHGALNNMAAKTVGLTEDDIKVMVEAMWNGTTELRTSSKNQQSRLLLRIRYNNPLAYIGDLDRRVKLVPTSAVKDLSSLEDISQVELDVSALAAAVESNASKIAGIDYIDNPDLICVNGEKKGRFADVFTSKVPLNSLG